MADVSLLFQGLRKDDFHSDAINNLLDFTNPVEFVFCVSFVRIEGLELIIENLEQVADRVVFILGIRNGITFAQAIGLLLKKNITTYCVDSGSAEILFHPKIVYAHNDTNASAMIGSSNATQRGLTRNIESSFKEGFQS